MTTTAPFAPERPVRHPAARRRWLVGGSILSALVLVGALFQVLTFIARETTVVETTFTADELAGVRVIEISGDRGSIEVTGSDTDEVHLRSRISRGLVAPTDEWRIDGHRLVVRSDCPLIFEDHCRVARELTVPDHIAVVVRSDTGGVRLTDLDGSVDVRTSLGRVDLAGLSGDLRVDTAMGDVNGSRLESSTVDVSVDHGTVDLTFADDPAEVSVRSTFGDVRIAVPDTPGTYAILTSTGFGDLRNELRTDARSEATIDVTTEFGSVDLRYAP